MSDAMRDLSPDVRELADRVSAALGERFRIDRVLGTGGFAVVYRVRDLDLKRDLAVKVLNPDLLSSPRVRERFQREAETIASLSHPHIVPLHFVGRRDNLLYLAMPCIDGGTLADRLAAGALPVPDAMRILREVASALDYAHKRGIMHRDVKPQNILLDTDARNSLVTDFGIARVDDAVTLTSTGLILGTPAYLSPEQLDGERGDQRSDLYALGVMAYEMVTGRLPFEGTTPTAILMRRMAGPPAAVTTLRADVPPALASAIHRCLALKPADRFASASEVLQAIEDAAAAEATGARRIPDRRRGVLARRWPWLTVAAVIALAGVVAYRARERVTPGAPFVATGLAVIPAGTYLIGSDSGPGNARPAHRVTLGQFAIGLREVTVREFADFARARGVSLPWATPPVDSSLPVTSVTWSRAGDYCRWRYLDGRLPTEEEWEAAARGAEGRAMPWRGATVGARANLATLGRRAIAPVGSYPAGATPEAVEDLLGNVWEWTGSPMVAYPGAAPLADSLGRYRVIRGGAFNTPEQIATPWLRGRARPTASAGELVNTGFRCAALFATPP